MILDHVVIRTPQRKALLNDLASRFRLRALEGFKINDVIHSEGIRFGNGPFIDVFDWPPDKPAFDPLLALEGDIAKVQHLADRHGWAARLHKRDDISVQDRPPWSTLSFARGQGLISSIFIIEYEDAPEAWQHEQYNGALYDRLSNTNGNAELIKVVVHCSDISRAQSQINLISGVPIPLLELDSANMHCEGVGAIDIRRSDDTVSRWPHSCFDDFWGP